MRLIGLALGAEHGAVRLRAEIVLAWVNGESGEATATRLGTSRRTVSKWRSRFRQGGIEALHDRPRPGAPRRVDDSTIAEVLRLRRSSPRAGGSTWSTRRIAQRTGLSQSTVVRITREYG